MAKNRDIYIAVGVGAMFFLLSQKSASAQTTSGSTGSSSNPLLGALNSALQSINKLASKPASSGGSSKSSPASGSNSPAAAAAALKAKGQAMLAAIGKAAANGFNAVLPTTDTSSAYNDNFLGFGDSPSYSAPDLSSSFGSDNATVTSSQTASLNGQDLGDVSDYTGDFLSFEATPTYSAPDLSSLFANDDSSATSTPSYSDPGGGGSTPPFYAGYDWNGSDDSGGYADYDW